MNKTYKSLKIILIFSITVVILFSFSALKSERENNQPVPELAAWYRNGLEEFYEEAKTMNRLAGKNIQWSRAKEQFLQLRLAYKKIAFLTDHFNPYETLQLNSAALPRAEEDNPEQVVPPQGMQKLEELLWAQEDTAEVRRQSEGILEIVQGMLNEPDYGYKFRPDAVWQSIREAIITVMTKGITGFDAPVSGMGLKESAAMLNGISALLETWKGISEVPEASLMEDLRVLLGKATGQLENAVSIDAFDRYGFLLKTMNPLYSQCVNTIMQVQKEQGAGLYALNDEALSLFDSNALNIAFFSPNIRYLPTQERVAIGRKLFFDPGLSSTGRRSCATCHIPVNGFADKLPKALAIDGQTILLRNTPTLLNVAFQTRQFYDSRMATLEFQVNNVVHNELEMGGSIENAVRRLHNDSSLRHLFKKAYPEETEAVNKFTVANALGSYMRSLKSLNARFDKAMRGESELTPGEQNGFNLFMGKAKCGTCHFMPVFNGLVPPRYSETESEVLGTPATKAKRTTLDTDSGKYLFTRSQVHLFAFKTPTLRNIALTAPYMHNGVFATLEQVIDFYDKGGGAGLGISPANQTLPPDRLNLTKQEKKDIISFLHTLTDTVGLYYGRW